MSALRKVINSEDDDVIKPMRIARAFPKKQATRLSQMEGGEPVQGSVRLVDTAQFAMQIREESSWNELLVLFFWDVESKKWIGMTSKRFFSLRFKDNDIKDVTIVKLKTVTSVQVEGNRLTLTYNKKSSRTCLLNDHETALEVRDIIDAAIHALMIGEK